MHGDIISESSTNSEDDQTKPDDESDNDPDHGNMAFHLLDFAFKAMKNGKRNRKE